MQRDWLAWALSGFWNWAPALVALDPTTMAYSEALREQSSSFATVAEVARHRNRADAAFRRTIWAGESEK